MATASSEDWDGHKVMELLERLSLKQCNEYLMNGYIKEHATKLQYTLYPFVLQQLSIKYLGDIFIRFKSSVSDPKSIEFMLNNKHATIIGQNNYCIITGHVTLLIDLPIPIHDNKLKIKWKLKLNAPRLPNGHYFIGIVSNNFKSFDETIWQYYYREKDKCNFENVYGAFGGSGCYRKSNKEGFEECAQERHGIYYRIVDTLINNEYGTDECNLSLEYDGSLKQLTIKNDQRDVTIACLDTQATNDAMYWYPTISLADHGDTAQIL